LLFDTPDILKIMFQVQLRASSLFLEALPYFVLEEKVRLSLTKILNKYA